MRPQPAASGTGRGRDARRRLPGPHRRITHSQRAWVPATFFVNTRSPDGRARAMVGQSRASVSGCRHAAFRFANLDRRSGPADANDDGAGACGRARMPEPNGVAARPARATGLAVVRGGVERRRHCPPIDPSSADRQRDPHACAQGRTPSVDTRFITLRSRLNPRTQSARKSWRTRSHSKVLFNSPSVCSPIPMASSMPSLTRIASEAGFLAAVTVEAGLVSAGTNRLLLPRSRSRPATTAPSRCACTNSSGLAWRNTKNYNTRSHDRSSERGHAKLVPVQPHDNGTRVGWRGARQTEK